MRRFFKQLRKGLKTACLAAALTTCWQIGQVAKADIIPGDEVTIQISGTVSPSTHNVSHLYLLFGSNYSFLHSIWSVNLGDFTAGQDTPFYTEMTTTYEPDETIYWIAAGLYGDISGGEYDEKINGVTLGVVGEEGDSWDSHSPWTDQETMFNRIMDNPDPFPSGYSNLQPWYYADITDLQESTTINLFNFSDATQNGQMQVNALVVPEPVSIILFGTGGMIVIALRRRKE